MKMRMIFVLLCISLCLNAKSQDEAILIMRIDSIIPKEITADSLGTIRIEITNKSAENIFVTNIPSIECEYEIFKKINDIYVRIDTSCLLLRDPILPSEEMQFVPFKKGRSIILPMDFPPVCIYRDTGNYRVRLLFTYYSKDLQPKLVGSESYQFKIIPRVQ